MKRQALFSSKDKSKNNKSVVCCNFACTLRFNIYMLRFVVSVSLSISYEYILNSKRNAKI